MSELLTVAALLGMAAVAIVAIRTLARESGAQRLLLGDMADRLMSRDLRTYKDEVAAHAPAAPAQEQPPADDEQRGMAKMRAAGLNPNDPDQVEAWQDMMERLGAETRT